MSAAYELPLTPQAQSFFIQLSNVLYRMSLRWNSVSNCWVFDLADSDEVPFLNGIPIVTGTDLLGQYAYLGMKGGLVALTDGNPDAVPTFANLGDSGNLYFLPDE
jgi:hypothetical protein